MTAKDKLPQALREAYLALHRRSEARFAKYGITADQFVLMATLARQDVLTQRELAHHMPSDPSTVRAMLVLLEGCGLVERHAHPTDRRARTVALTAAGKRKFRQVWRAGETIRERMASSLDAGQVETLVRLLTSITRSLEPASGPIQAAPTG